MPPTTRAQDGWPKYDKEATDLLQQYLRIDTSNPPGNEKRAAEFFCALFAKESIECQIFEIAPGRANAYARLKGDGTKRPLILLNHTDVVIADPKLWSVPPFSAEIRNGAIYARGAQDMKSEGMLQAMVLLALKRENVKLSRDVIFLAVADEEAATAGTEWMLKNKPDLVANAEFLINEGGENVIEGGAVAFWGVDVAEKAPFWLRLTAKGRAGHGSVPHADAAPHRLARALARVVDYETPLKVTPLSQQIFCDLARVRFPTEKDKFCKLEDSLRDAGFRKRISENPDWAFMLRNTISLTVMKGGPQTNVIPAEATAELDVRLLPGEEPQKFLEEIKKVIADDTIQIEPISKIRTPNESPANTELWRAFEEVVGKYFPKTVVSPRLTSGYTENQIYRQLGIHSYGFCPFVSTREEADTPHGTDERILVKEFQPGLRVLFDVVTRVAEKQ
ncbi:MAG TPA: M20/M25/M40 family metallo-hydrolase [Candidatus Acidoferrales bacterium]|nr:M20/M25/M40 family metallo-hydrolase [Candidatus Acidoferrales bacterium]